MFFYPHVLTGWHTHNIWENGGYTKNYTKLIYCVIFFTHSYIKNRGKITQIGKFLLFLMWGHFINFFNKIHRGIHTFNH